MLLHDVVLLYDYSLSMITPLSSLPRNILLFETKHAVFWIFFFNHMKSFRFFGPTRETTEEGDDVRESREGERTAVPGGNRQVVSRQLVSCGGENTKKGLRGHCARAAAIDVTFRGSLVLIRRKSTCRYNTIVTPYRETPWIYILEVSLS